MLISNAGGTRHPRDAGSVRGWAILIRGGAIAEYLPLMTDIHRFELKTNWSWRQCEDGQLEKSVAAADGWRATQAYPSEIHVELLKAGSIPHPYLAFNEHLVQCTFTLATSLYITMFINNQGLAKQSGSTSATLTSMRRPLGVHTPSSSSSAWTLAAMST